MRVEEGFTLINGGVAKLSNDFEAIYHKVENVTRVVRKSEFLGEGYVNLWHTSFYEFWS